MNESAKDTSASSEPAQDLVLNGLRHFSHGNVEEANAAWNQVLEVEPNHERATDYLTNSMIDMESDRDPAEAMTSAKSVLGAYDDVLEDIRELHQVIVNLIKTGALEEALVLLEHVCDTVDGGEEQFGRVRRLVRNLLALRYALHLGPLGQRVVGSETQAPPDLASEEMHVLALVDVTGSEQAMTIADLLDASLYGPFLTFRALVTLRHRELVALEQEDGFAETYGDSEAAAGDIPPPPQPADVPSEIVDSEDAEEADTEEADAEESDDTSPEQEPEEEAGEGASPDASPPSDSSAEDDPAGSHTTSSSSQSPGAEENAPAPSEEAEADGDFDALFRKGVSLYVQGEFEKARRRFEKCLDLRPDDPRAKRNLERVKRQE